MEIVVAEPEQVDAMVAITEQARANMAAMGIDQWQCGYPDRSTWEADVAAGAAYVALDEGRVVAVFRYADEPEAAGVGHRRRQLCVGHPRHAALEDGIADAEQFGNSCFQHWFSPPRKTVGPRPSGAAHGVAASSL